MPGNVRHCGIVSIKKIVFFLFSLSFWLPTGAAVAQRITVFQNSNFGGQSDVFSEDVPNLSSVPGPCAGNNWNDCVSSIWVPPGTVATVYSESNYQGSSTVLMYDEPDLQSVTGPCAGGFSKCISSIRLRRTFSVTVDVNGDGRVSSSPAGINNCSLNCSAWFPEGTSVSLTETGVDGSQFKKWEGECSGAGSCTVIVNGHKLVGAVFTGQVVLSLQPSVVTSNAAFALTLTAKIPSGTNTVTRDQVTHNGAPAGDHILNFLNFNNTQTAGSRVSDNLAFSRTDNGVFEWQVTADGFTGKATLTINIGQRSASAQLVGVNSVGVGPVQNPHKSIAYFRFAWKNPTILSAGGQCGIINAGPNDPYVATYRNTHLSVNAGDNVLITNIALAEHNLMNAAKLNRELLIYDGTKVLDNITGGLFSDAVELAKLFFDSGITIPKQATQFVVHDTGDGLAGQGESYIAQVSEVVPSGGGLPLTINASTDVTIAAKNTNLTYNQNCLGDFNISDNHSIVDLTTATEFCLAIFSPTGLCQ